MAQPIVIDHSPRRWARLTQHFGPDAVRQALCRVQAAHAAISRDAGLPMPTLAVCSAGWDEPLRRKGDKTLLEITWGLTGLIDLPDGRSEIVSRLSVAFPLLCRDDLLLRRLLVHEIAHAVLGHPYDTPFGFCRSHSNPAVMRAKREVEAWRLARKWQAQPENNHTFLAK